MIDFLHHLDLTRSTRLSMYVWHRRALAGYLILLQLWFPGVFAAAATEAPVADVHVHFNWDQKELVTAAEVVRRLQHNNVQLAVVMGTPSDLALELRAAGGNWILPVFSPYIEINSRHNWFADERVLVRARQALSSGKYFGIGEVHLVAGIGPRRNNPIFEGLLQLAAEFEVPIIVHTEASSYKYFLPVCKKFPKVRIQWAHAGGILPVTQIEQLLVACENVWVDLSARDPWHYGGLGETGELNNDWRDLMMRYSDRIMIGSDPVWNAHQIDKWYEADTGWDHLGQIWQFHRQWLRALPPELAEKIRLKNARVFYGVEAR